MPQTSWCRSASTAGSYERTSWAAADMLVPISWICSHPADRVAGRVRQPLINVYLLVVDQRLADEFEKLGLDLLALHPATDRSDSSQTLRRHIHAFNRRWRFTGMRRRQSY